MQIYKACVTPSQAFYETLNDLTRGIKEGNVFLAESSEVVVIDGTEYK